MRRVFAELLLHEMESNERLVVISADMGFGVWDAVRATYPERFFNTGAAEQAAAGICVGLALCGKMPVLYSITPFLLCRPFEFWRNYLNHEGIPVKLVGSGRGHDYSHDGFTHYAGDDAAITRLWPRVDCFWPQDEAALRAVFPTFLHSGNPAYLNLRR